MVEHIVTQVRLHLDGGAEDAHTPTEPADDHGQDHPDQGHTDLVQQEVHVEGHFHAIHQDVALVQAVNDHLVKIRDHQLEVVHRHQRRQAHQEPPGVLEIIAVDVLSEDHLVSSSL